MSLTAGTAFGSYEIGDLLGKGGMGEVYLATDTRLRRQVAVKVLPGLLAADPERLARFEREAQVLASLSHPHIAHVYGLEEARTTAGGQLTRAIVMELVEGRTLDEVIGGASMPADEALRVARQIADALEAAHEKGVIHRDLKPANVKVADDGTVKVLDFGLAKAMDPSPASGPTYEHPTITSPALTELGIILGTAAYMSPEQARGKSVDRRADVWAFGCVLYEMLTGRRAFDGEDMTAVLARVIERDPDLSALPAGTPPAVRRLIERARRCSRFRSRRSTDRRCCSRRRARRLPGSGCEWRPSRFAGRGQPPDPDLQLAGQHEVTNRVRRVRPYGGRASAPAISGTAPAPARFRRRS